MDGSDAVGMHKQPGKKKLHSLTSLTQYWEGIPFGDSTEARTRCSPCRPDLSMLFGMACIAEWRDGLRLTTAPAEAFAPPSEPLNHVYDN